MKPSLRWVWYLFNEEQLRERKKSSSLESSDSYETDEVIMHAKLVAGPILLARSPCPLRRLGFADARRARRPRPATRGAWWRAWHSTKRRRGKLDQDNTSRLVPCAAPRPPTILTPDYRRGRPAPETHKKRDRQTGRSPGLTGLTFVQTFVIWDFSFL